MFDSLPVPALVIETVSDLTSNVGKLYRITPGAITGTGWGTTPYSLTIAEPPVGGTTASAKATYVAEVPAVIADPDATPALVAADAVPAYFEITYYNLGAGYLVAPSVTFETPPDTATGLACDFTSSIVLTALNNDAVASDATASLLSDYTQANNELTLTNDDKDDALDYKTAAVTKKDAAADAAALAHAAQIAKNVDEVKTQRDAAGLAAGVAYTNTSSELVVANTVDTDPRGSLGNALNARLSASNSKDHSIAVSIAAGVSYIDANGLYVVPSSGADSKAKESERGVSNALIDYNRDLNIYKNALSVPMSDADRLSQADLDDLMNDLNGLASTYNTLKALANKDRSVANEAAAKAAAAVLAADAALAAAVAAEAAAEAAKNYYLQTEQDIINAARVPVSIDMNIEIDAQNNINIFGEKPVLPTNVIEARYKLPVEALYDNAANIGLIEFWEPVDSQGDIRVELAHSNLCGTATAVLVLNGDGVASITVDTSGLAYKKTPLVMLESVNGLGSGAVAHAVIVNGAIDSFVVDHPGSGYTAAPRVRISSPDHDYTDAYKSTALKFVNGMERILCDQFDCSGANPFSDKKYRDSDGNPIEQYTKQRDFGRVALATLSHYLFGHVDATAAITNDVQFVESMLSLSNTATANLAVQYETDERYPTGHPKAGQSIGAVKRYDHFTPLATGVEVDATIQLKGSADDALLAQRLVGAILKKGLKPDGSFMSSNVIANAASDKTCLANIVRQVLGQDETRSMNEDNSQRAIDQHALLRFYAGDVIYMTIKVKRPNVTFSPGYTNMPSDAASSYANEISFALKVTLE